MVANLINPKKKSSKFMSEHEIHLEKERAEANRERKRRRKGKR